MHYDIMDINKLTKIANENKFDTEYHFLSEKPWHCLNDPQDGVLKQNISVSALVSLQLMW